MKGFRWVWAIFMINFFLAASRQNAKNIDTFNLELLPMLPEFPSKVISKSAYQGERNNSTWRETGKLLYWIIGWVGTDTSDEKWQSQATITWSWDDQGNSSYCCFIHWISIDQDGCTLLDKWCKPSFHKTTMSWPFVRRLSLQLHSMQTMSGSVKKNLFFFIFSYLHSIYLWFLELFGYAIVRSSCTSAEEWALPLSPCCPWIFFHQQSLVVGEVGPPAGPPG